LFAEGISSYTGAILNTIHSAKMERRPSTIPAKSTKKVDLNIKGKTITNTVEKKASKAKLVSPTRVENAQSMDQQPKTRKSSAAKSSIQVQRKQTLTKKMTIQENQKNVIMQKPASENSRKSRAIPPHIILSVGEKQKEQTNPRPSCSLSPLQRRNGLAESPLASPTSPYLSPGPFKKPAQSPSTRRKAFFAKDSTVDKNNKARRDAVSSTTDDFAKERMAVRVLWKKF